MTKHSLDVWSPQLRAHRRVDVYLPGSYGAHSRRRYPVLYIHDGQNLSDPTTAFAGATWDLEGALARAATRGVELIAVGIHHGGDQRVAELSPFPDPKHGGGRGDRYVRFVAGTLKRTIDARYRTRPDRDSTGLAGSSMGGLITLYAFFREGSPFGAAAVMSPSIWFGERRIVEFVGGAAGARGRIYLDVGTDEGAGTLRDARALARLLRTKGYRPGDTLRYVEARGQRHEEAAWARRLPAALTFLFRNRA